MNGGDREGRLREKGESQPRSPSSQRSLEARPRVRLGRKLVFPRRELEDLGKRGLWAAARTLELAG